MDTQHEFDQLPEYDPHPDLWNRIEKDLNAEAKLDRALSDLPSFEPEATAWDRLQRQLEDTQTVIRPMPQRKVWWWAAAAMLSALAGSWLFWHESASEKVTVAYSEEIASPATQKFMVRSPDAETLISQRCKELETICQKPEIKELQHELHDLNARQAKLDEQLSVFGEDPDLLQARDKLAGQRAEVTQELVTLLRI